MSAVMDEEIKRWTARRKSALVLQERGPRTGSGSLKGEERGQVYLISCFFRPSAWAMGRPGRSEASGLRFDLCLEGVAAQCPLLLQVEADFAAKGTEVINRIDCIAHFVALRTPPALHTFRVGRPQILTGPAPPVGL